MPFKDKNKDREYRRIWMKKRRESWFKGKCCVFCGSTCKLQIDHIDRKEKVSHRIWSWTKSKRDLELAKCQVLCYNCHLEKTRMELQVDSPHDGVSRGAYRKGCRCDLCKAANREYSKKWKMLHKQKILEE